MFIRQMVPYITNSIKNRDMNRADTGNMKYNGGTFKVVNGIVRF